MVVEAEKAGLGRVQGGHGGGLSDGLEEVLANSVVPQKGEAVVRQHHVGGELLTSNGQQMAMSLDGGSNTPPIS